MKKNISQLILAAFALLVINSCSNEPKQVEISTKEKVEKTELLAENKKAVDMEVEGMTCAMGCAKYIEDKVAGLNGVVLSQVNFEEGTAHFEFDETALSSEEIESFINEIHDGQYKAKIAEKKEAEETEEEDDSSDEDETVASVSENLNFSFPELFTYFLKRL